MTLTCFAQKCLILIFSLFIFHSEREKKKKIFEIRKEKKSRENFSSLNFSFFQIIQNHRFKNGWKELFKVPGVKKFSHFLLKIQNFCSLKGNFLFLNFFLLKVFHAHRKRNIYRERIWRNCWSGWDVWWRIRTSSVEFTFVRHRNQELF